MLITMNKFEKIMSEYTLNVLPGYMYSKYGIYCYDSNGELRHIYEILNNVFEIFCSLSESDKDDVMKCMGEIKRYGNVI